MISSNELRIGNLILINRTFQEVCGITEYSVSSVAAGTGVSGKVEEHSLENAEPIALTDEVLMDCGFVFHDYFKFWQMVITGVRSEMDLDRDYDLIDFMRRPIIKKLVSLHQLQNVYFMMKGRELSYKRQPQLV